MIQLNEITAGRQLTLSSASWLLARYPQAEWLHPAEFTMISESVREAMAQVGPLPRTPELTKPRRDARSPCVSMNHLQRPMNVYTDYADISKSISKKTEFKVVESPEEADFLLLLKQIKDFTALPSHQFIGQFPYEGGLVRKDLLLLTVRRYCYRGDTPPSWWLPCFDMSTEFHLFYEEYIRRTSAREDNWWILKPSQGGRGQGHKIAFSVSDPDNCPIQEVASFCNPFGANNENDKVAQLLVQRPVLARGRKFDLRLFVVVRSFCPFEAYVHNTFYARLANKPYECSELSDTEVSITNTAYDDDIEIASRQERLISHDLRDVLLSEIWGLSPTDRSSERYEIGIHWWNSIILSLHQLLRELFGGTAPSIGEWPLSRAYYGVDIILDRCGVEKISTPESVAAHSPTATKSSNEQDRFDVFHFSKASESLTREKYTPVPKLMEVNYMGDWGPMKAVLRANSLKYNEDGADVSRYDFEDWSSEMLDALMSTKDVNSTAFTRL